MLTAAGLLVAAGAEANPIMTNLCGGSGVSYQTVTMSFEVSYLPNEPLELYRIKGNEQVLVATLTAEDGESSSADMGSGVQGTTRFSIEDTCVPVGDWTYQVLDGNQDAWCSWSGEVIAEDPDCLVVAEDEPADESCALHGAAGQHRSMAPVALALLAAFGWLARRRRT